VGRHAGRGALDRAIDVGNGTFEGRFVVRRARRRALVAHAAAPDEIHAVVACMTGHRVHEAQRFDAEAQPEKLHAQLCQTLHLVAQRRRPLELEARAARFHLAPQCIERRVIGAVEKCAREREAFVVLPLGAPADTRAQALVNLEADASRRARDLKELALIGEVHRPLERAVAEAERVVELAQ